MILRHRFPLTNQGKLFKRHTLIKVSYLKDIPWFEFCLCTMIYFFVNSLPWPLDIHGSELSFYCNIFLLKYCVQKYLVCKSDKKLCGSSPRKEVIIVDQCRSDFKLHKYFFSYSSRHLWPLFVSKIWRISEMWLHYWPRSKFGWSC